MRLFKRSGIGRYIWNLLIALDQLGHCVFFWNCNPDMTISERSRIAYEKGKRWAKVMCAFLDIFEDEHCAKSRDTQIP